MTPEQIAKLRVGERVGMYRRHNGSILYSAFGVVSKRYKTGHVIVTRDAADCNAQPETQRFNSSGREVGNLCLGFSLCTASRLEQELAEQNLADKRWQAIYRFALLVEDRVRSCRGIRGVTKGNLTFFVESCQAALSEVKEPSVEKELTQ